MRKLALVTGDATYAKAAGDLLSRAASAGAAAMIGSVGTLGLALEYRAHPDTLIAIAGKVSGDGGDALLNTAIGTYRPGKIVKRDESGHGPSKPDAIVCAGAACAPPTENPSKLAELLKTFEVGSGASGPIANKSRDKRDDAKDAQAIRESARRRD
jgi:uncharacterized protein YyaL (SSP411 family)